MMTGACQGLNPRRSCEVWPVGLGEADRYRQAKQNLALVVPEGNWVMGGGRRRGSNLHLRG